LRADYQPTGLQRFQPCNVQLRRSQLYARLS